MYLSVYLASLEMLWPVLLGTQWLPVVSPHLDHDPLDYIHAEVMWSFQGHHSAELGTVHSRYWAVFGRLGLGTCQMSLFSQGKEEYHHRYQMWGSC